jgi:hypothetical protein
MTNEQAYKSLKEKRPVIVAVLHRDKIKYGTAKQLSSSTIARDDPAELIELIKKSSEYIFTQTQM